MRLDGGNSIEMFPPLLNSIWLSYRLSTGLVEEHLYAWSATGALVLHMDRMVDSGVGFARRGLPATPGRGGGGC